MERLVVRTIVLEWEPTARLGHIWFTAPTETRGDDATELVAAMRRWVGPDAKPFALLGDGGRLAKLDADYRRIWGTFFKEQRETAHLAFYGMNPVVRLAAEMFRLGTGTKLRAFRDETGARAWLRESGFDA